MESNKQKEISIARMATTLARITDESDEPTIKKMAHDALAEYLNSKADSLPINPLNPTQ